MSRHIFKTKINDKNISVILGWDKTLQGFFMDIIKDDIDKTDVDYLEINPDDSLHDTCIYESLYDHKTNFGHIDDINYFLDVLDDMSVGIPSVMVEMLQSDKENDVGNEVWQYRYDRDELIMVSELREMPEKTA